MMRVKSPLVDVVRDAARSGRSVVAVAVSYNPDVDMFERALRAVASQVAGVVVVDNGSKTEDIETLEHRCGGFVHVERLMSNVGIGAAQNRGIEFARAAGATTVILLDHDSVPSPDMVARLAAALDRLEQGGESIAAVGPAVLDRQTKTVAPVPQSDSVTVSFVALDGDVPVKSDYLIASGMMISLDAYARVGRMNEAYFIDQVDVEWGFRATSAGLSMYCVPDAILEHAIGDATVRFWALGWREIAVHSPLRDYFYFRNTLRLIGSGYVPKAWRRYWLRRLGKMFVMNLVFIAPRWERLLAMTRGIVHAMNARASSSK
jgi:rhamnosyltransferase